MHIKCCQFPLEHKPLLCPLKNQKMQTVTVDILNDKAERLLEELERQELIRVRNEKHRTPAIINWAGKYKDASIDRVPNHQKKKLHKECE